MSYSVVLGTNDQAVQKALQSQLSELPDIHLADVVHSSSEVTSYLSTAENIDCLLLHESLGPLPVLDLVREVTARQPYLAIVLIVSDQQPATLTAAMESGARGVVSTAPSLEDLENRIGNASDWSRTMRSHMEGYGPEVGSGGSGRLIALAGAKGGTGTTTTAVHLAVAAASAHRTVCLVDMDLQTGDLATFLDVSHRRSIIDLADAADDLNATSLADALFAHRLGPHVLLAPREGERAEDIDGRAARQILGSLRSRYDLVIVDCGSYVNEANAMAAELADRVVIATSPDLPALRGARRLTELWERLQVRKKEDVVILLTRHSRNIEIQPDFARKVLRMDLLTTTIPASFRALESGTNTGAPGEVNDPAFRRAIGRVLRELGGTTAREAPMSVSEHGAADPAKQKKARKPKQRKRGERGQASVEFIGMLPAIIAIMMLMWEAVVLGMAMQTASHGANEGARTAAVTDSPEEVRKSVKDHMTDTWADRATIGYDEGDEEVTVSLYVPVLVPGMHLPWQVTTSSDVVHEGPVDGGAS